MKRLVIIAYLLAQFCKPLFAVINGYGLWYERQRRQREEDR